MQAWGVFFTPLNRFSTDKKNVSYFFILFKGRFLAENEAEFDNLLSDNEMTYEQTVMMVY